MYHVLAMLKGVTERYHPLKKDGGVGGGGRQNMFYSVSLGVRSAERF